MAIEMMSISHCYCSDYMTKPTQFGDEPKKSANLSDFSTLKLTSSELVFKIEIKLKVKGTLIINFQLLIIN